MGRSLRPRWLASAITELGGKSPNIVFADADLDAAASTSPMPGELTPSAWDEPGCPINSRALGDLTAFDEITR